MKILIVDDQQDWREMLVMVVAHAGYTVESAAGGKEAIEKGNAFAPDVVLLDLAMPDIDGFQVIAALKPRLPKSDFIAVTGWTRPEDVSQCAVAGFSGHVGKPVDPVRFIRFLADLTKLRAGDTDHALPGLRKTGSGHSAEKAPESVNLPGPKNPKE